jgi:hypothetical protein
MVGDYILRCETIFGKKIDDKIWANERQQEIQILVTRSGIDHYIHATNEVGETRIFDTQQDLHKATCVWIPRLDQLQKMIKIEQNYPGSFLYQHMDEIDEMIFSVYKDKHIYLQTYPAVWIAYVMYKNYSKKWNGENWE